MEAPSRPSSRVCAVALLSALVGAGCQDADVLRVRRMETRLAVDLGLLRVMAANRERTGAELDLARRKLAEVQQELRGAEAALDGAGRRSLRGCHATAPAVAAVRGGVGPGARPPARVQPAPGDAP